MNENNVLKHMKRTKIITTTGPATNSAAAIEELFVKGMTTIRLNFSHGDHQEQGNRITWAKQVMKKIGKPISIMLDTKGPEIRVGKMLNDNQEVVKNSDVTVYTKEEDYLNKVCQGNEMTVSYDMSKDLKIGDVILVDDGKLHLDVISVEPGVIHAKAFNHHLLKTNKRINLPAIDFSLPFLSERDIRDITFGIEQGIDYIAASFVNSAENVQQIRDLLKKLNAEHVQIIAKIESQIGIQNIDEIIAVSDGIMVARGDLGLEIPYYDVPYWEKVLIRKCRKAGKLVIVATQMLESMTDSPAPTRAEVTDVYFATELGADATMLSGESANGNYPFIATDVMATINRRAEVEFYSKLYYEKQFNDALKSISGPRAEIVKKLAEKCKSGDYPYAVVLSRTGQLLKALSKFRPNTFVIGVSNDDKLYTTFGCYHSIFMNKVSDYENFIQSDEEILAVAKSWGAKTGQKVLFMRSTEIRELVVS